jgi:hypothetical protein
MALGRQRRTLIAYPRRSVRLNLSDEEHEPTPRPSYPTDVAVKEYILSKHLVPAAKRLRMSR